MAWQYKHVTELSQAVSQRLKRDAAGLFAAIIQDVHSKRVLMLGYMDDQALARTLQEGRVTFWSRSRKQYWRKGDTSGNYLYLRDIHIDCDGDALLLQVEALGPTCHTGETSCFDAGGTLSGANFQAGLGGQVLRLPVKNLRSGEFGGGESA